MVRDIIATGTVPTITEVVPTITEVVPTIIGDPTGITAGTTDIGKAPQLRDKRQGTFKGGAIGVRMRKGHFREQRMSRRSLVG